VKSALVMRENLRSSPRGLRVPVLLGGAASPKSSWPRSASRVPRAGGLLRRRVRGPVGHAPDRRGDPFLDRLRRGATAPAMTRAPGGRGRPGQPGARARRSWGAVPSTGSTRRSCTPTSTSRRSSAAGGGTGGEDDRRGVRGTGAGEGPSMYEELKRRGVRERLLDPKVVYGWFRAFADGDTLVWSTTGARGPSLPPAEEPAAPVHRGLLPDPEEEGTSRVLRGDHRGGDGPGDAELFTSDRYHDYLMLHAFGSRSPTPWRSTGTRRCAASWGSRRITRPPSRLRRPGYQGSRYGFGYPPARTSPRTRRCSSCSTRAGSA